MNLFRKILSALVLSAVLPVASLAAELTAVESAESSVNQLLARVQELRPLFDADKDAYFAGIEEQISTFVDFREVALGVMAGYSEQAADEQIDAFADKLKSTLTRFYGSTLVEYGGQELTYLPSTQAPPDPENATNVRMQINSGNTRIELQYTMFLNADREWKLKNLYLGGINLRRQYYTQFAALMNRHNNDIDQVIANWK
jgi:phospholipid transport system substrate-binding protein